VHATNRVEGLTDVALPSLVTHPPAFTVVNAGPDGIDTAPQSLADLAPDPVLTALYRAEGRTDPPMPYGAFLAAQFRARVRNVRLPRDWPQPVLDWMQARHAGDLAELVGAHDIAPHRDALMDYALTDLAADIYLLRDGGTLATGHVPPDRLHLCHLLARHGDAAADPDLSVAAFWRRFLSVLPAATR